MKKPSCTNLRLLLVAAVLIPALPAMSHAEDAVEAPLIEIKNARQPLPGVLSGGQVTPEQLAEAAQAGYRTVINLRTAGEDLGFDENAKVEALDMTYVSMPIAGSDGLTPENAEKLARLLEESEKPLILHCGSGNRIGALFALMAHHLDGKGKEEALDIGLEAGLTRLEPKVREILGLPPNGE